MRKTFASLILRLIGWKIVGTLPAGGPRCVVMMAPHTSNLDFFMGWLGYSSVGYTANFLIKKEAFNFFTTPLLRKMGGVAVDRTHSSNIVHQLTEEFKRRDKFILTITPEGTRRPNKHWKKGFYFIALSANVPIVMGFLDYKKKEGGFGPIFYPSGNYEADFEAIRAFYKTKQGRYPEKFVIPDISTAPAHPIEAAHSRV
ncbi:MAG: 1-acyl-sn-glycerol-3-phosphate acyltransferase [Lentimicrobiaceae bacterium]|nr:1-acyl-sn-glycerol-3-phosphate acyltransferase [Lentimicrobiaceae bacterium]